MDYNLTDKIVIITGAAGFIGKATAKKFLEEGARVAILDIGGSRLSAAVDELKAISAEIKGYECDITNEDSVKETVDEILGDWGRIDCLVNNAGIGMPAPIQEMSLESWKKVIDVNLTGVFLLSKYCFLQMMKQKSGAIVSIGSFAARMGTLYGDNTSYSASKAGVLGFSNSLSIEGARYGIRSNAVCPGVVKTPILDTHSEERKQEMTSKMLMRRMAAPEEIADVVVFLCSDRASYVTGEVMDVNGGLYLD